MNRNDVSGFIAQEMEKELLANVISEAEKNLKDPILILSGENWHEGIIGIIASRIKDKYHKPTFIISLKGTNGKGSARSIFGFDIGLAIKNAFDFNIVLRGGPHKMAAGFTIEKKKLKYFDEFIKNY